MKRWIAILVTAMLAILQTGAFAECDDEISNYTRYADYIPQAAEPVGLSPGENHRTSQNTGRLVLTGREYRV